MKASAESAWHRQINEQLIHGARKAPGPAGGQAAGWRQQGLLHRGAAAILAQVRSGLSGYGLRL